jgi:hypothetical protein
MTLTYTKSRQKLGGKRQGGARRDLEDLHAAINQTRADIHDGPEQNSRPAHELGELRGNALAVECRLPDPNGRAFCR